MGATLLDFLASNILREERLGDFREVVERAGWWSVELLRCCISKARGEWKAHYSVVLRVEHLLLKIADVLHWIARSIVAVESESQDFFGSSHPWMSLESEES